MRFVKFEVILYIFVWDSYLGGDATCQHEILHGGRYGSTTDLLPLQGVYNSWKSPGI